MTNIVLPGVGAGLVSALLLASATRGGAMALLLFLLAPIPILIVTLGWNHRSGLVAAAVGGAATALVLSPLKGLAFALGTAVPSWWLGYLALLGRPAADGVIEWYPIGRLLAWVVAIAALTVVINLSISFPSFETYETSLRAAVEEFLRRQTSTPEGAALPTSEALPTAAIVASAPVLVPMIAAHTLVLSFAFYLWVGGKVVAVSGRLPRPWPYLPATVMPPSIVGMLVVGIVMANFGGFVGLFGLAVLGALVAAFTLQGLAALHHLTVGRPGRRVLLFFAYGLLFMSQGLLMLPLVLFAILDSAFGIRDRLKPPAPPGAPTNPPPGQWPGRNP